MRGVLCIDLEPDQRDGTGGGAGAWSGATSIVADARWLRTSMDASARAPLSWFVRTDPHIGSICGSPGWALKRFSPGLAGSVADGDELGIHPHSMRWSGDAAGWVNDWSDEFTQAVVGCALDTYEATIGQPCRIYRHGDRFTSPVLVRALLDSSVEVDLTPEPGAPALLTLLPTEVATGGAIPHVDAALSRPYQPDPSSVNLPVVPDGRLTMVPMTTVAVPNGRHEVLWLTMSPTEFRRRLRIRLLDPMIAHVAFALRSDVFRDEGSREAITTNLACLRQLVPDLRWVAASDFIGAAHAPEEFRADASGALAAQADAVLEVLADHAAAPAALPVVVAQRAAEQLASARQRLQAVEGTLTWRLHEAARRLLRRLRRPRSGPRNPGPRVSRWR